MNTLWSPLTRGTTNDGQPKLPGIWLFNIWVTEEKGLSPLFSYLPAQWTRSHIDKSIFFSSYFIKDKTWTDEKAVDLQMFLPWGPLCWLIIYVCLSLVWSLIGSFTQNVLFYSSSNHFIFQCLFYLSYTSEELVLRWEWWSSKPGWNVSTVRPAKTEKSKPKVLKPLSWEKQAVAIFIFLLWTFVSFYIL